MITINACFLDTPTIEINNVSITITQNKYEALFIYLLINKSCTRNELISLFWADVSENRARKNLRNALYNIKKTYGSDMITTVGYSKINISENIVLNLDVESVTNNNNVYECVNKFKYKGFLYNYNVNCSGFQEWMTIQRRLYADIFINKYSIEKKHAKANKNTDVFIEICYKLLEINPYDDETYIDLMDCYYTIGKYTKSIEIYNKLEEVLYRELGVEPSLKAKNLLTQVVKSRNFVSTEYMANKSSDFYGRIKEKLIIKNEIERFYNKEDYKHVVLYGEKGIGKTALICNLINNEKENYNFYYYYVNNNNGLTENHMVSFVENFIKKYNIDCDISVNLKNIPINFSDIVGDKKICFIIDGIENLDKDDLCILYNIIEKRLNNNAMFIILYTNGCNENDAYIDNYYLKGDLTVVPLARFTKEETEVVVDISLDKTIQNNTGYQEIFDVTRGVPYFIKIAVANVKNSLEVNEVNNSSLAKFLINMSLTEREICEFLCLFNKPVKLIEFIDIYPDNKKLLNVIEKLSKKRIVEEVIIKTEMHIYFSIPMVKEYFYNKLYIGKKIAYHYNIGEYYNEIYIENTNKKELLYDIFYNYSQTGDNYKHLYYKIKYLEHRLNYSDEFFPVWHTYQNHYESLFLKREKSYLILDEIETKLTNLESSISKEELRECLLIFYYIKGRTYIRDNNFEIGIYNINKLLDMIESDHDNVYVFKAYYELVVHGLKTNDVILYEKFLIKLGTTSIIKSEDIYLSIYYRMVGLYNFLIENYDESIEYLDKSIDILKRAKGFFNYNFLNIVASINYKGDVYKLKKDYINAKIYYKKAIEICESKSVIKSMDLLNKNYGEILYLQGDKKEAKKYFEKSIKYSNLLTSHWEKSIAECYMAVISFENSEYDKAKEYLSKGEIYIRKKPTNYEKNVLDWARKTIHIKA